MNFGDYVKYASKLSNINSYNVSVLQNNKITYYSNCSSNTRFPIGSLSKAFGALCIHKLVKDGSCTLDDPISKWIDTDINLTIGDILNHQSNYNNKL